MTQVIEVRHLHKAYGGVTAVDDLSFNVEEGEIFAIIGPNGAGKSTTIESLIGLRRPDGGSVSVLGLDSQRDSRALGDHIGAYYRGCDSVVVSGGYTKYRYAS